MIPIKHFLSILLYALPLPLAAQSTLPHTLETSGTNGYYKDIFMDSGISLTSRKDLPAARYLGLSLEKFVSAVNSKTDSITVRDTLYQHALISGSATDANGILLYPDGAPRFRMIYVNGGSATKHGASLAETGRNAIRRFVAEGGSYVGTCAGAFIASDKFSDSTASNPRYLHIWPGTTVKTRLTNAHTGMFVEKDSPLLRYYDFGGDLYIDSVRHNGGCYAYTRTMPKGTEILLRYDCDTAHLKNSIHQEISAWAYKASDTAGRVVSIGSHPEGVTSGERLELMSALIRYAIDGNGRPQLKAYLENGRPRAMIQASEAQMPLYARIGDKQYHHFAVEIPQGTDTLTISLQGLTGWKDFDLYLLAGDTFAFLPRASHKNIALGTDKTLVIPHPHEGLYYISVFCATTVDTLETRYGTQYTGRTDVLNGVPYIIKVSYNAYKDKR